MDPAEQWAIEAGWDPTCERCGRRHGVNECGPVECTECGSRNVIPDPDDRGYACPACGKLDRW